LPVSLVVLLQQNKKKKTNKQKQKQNPSTQRRHSNFCVQYGQNVKEMPKNRQLTQRKGTSVIT